MITKSCIRQKDGSCAAVCPVDCIHSTQQEPGFAEIEHLFINPDECIDCDACVHECPVDAIFTYNELPEELSHFETKAAEYYAVDNP